MTIRIVHVSDIHFGQERNGTLSFYDNVRDYLVKDAKTMRDKLGPATAVMVVGDVSYSAKKAEYEKAGLFLDALTQAAGCEVTSVAMVPGNHDCDWKELNHITRMLVNTVRTGEVAGAYALLDDIAKGAEEACLILPKLRAYRDFALGYQCDFISRDKLYWLKPFEITSGLFLRFRGLTTVQITDENDGLGKMILGPNQYIWTEDANCIDVAVMHHPVEWLKDKSEATKYLNARCRVVMTGHEHDPKLVKEIDQFKRERLDIHSGATSPEAGAYKHTYNWIEFSYRNDEGKHLLHVKTYPRVWNAQAKFGADTEATGGGDYIEFEVQCPGIEFPQSKQGSKAPPPGGVAMTQSGSGATVDQNMEAGVAKLCFLFWRHLDWQQRLKVLVDANVLPSLADRPLPQTLERLALENAKREGKLHSVWEGMNKLLPEEKRESNPFTKKDN